MRVFVTRRLPGGVEVPSSRDLQVDVWPHRGAPPTDELHARVRDAHGLLCMLTDRVDDELLSGAPQLKVVSQMAVGVDNIDLEAARRRGIPVGHTPGVLVEATADLCWALILATARRLGEAERFLRDGRWTRWEPDLLLGKELNGATLGIVGLGAIGAAVARRAAGFGMRVCYWSRRRKPGSEAEFVPLDDLLARSDVVSVNVALTDQTRRLIGPRELSLMKPDAILVNTARGGVVDEDALVEALRDGRLGGAGLDVYASEPLATDSPLLGFENLVLVPHIGSATVHARRRMAEIAVENLLAGLEGRPLPHRAG